MVEHRETLIFIDAPYRLSTVLKALAESFGLERAAAVACNLTMPDENFVRGTLGTLGKHFEKKPFKGEFVIIVQGKVKRSRTR